MGALKTRIILIRHGETVKNIEGVLHRRSDNSVLSDFGRRQIKVTVERLRSESVDVIYTSKEKRALESSLIISRLLGKESKPMDGLEERDWGIYEGQPWSNVKSVLDTLTLEQRYAFVPEKGESWKNFESRTITTVKKVIDKNRGKVIVLVTHGGVIRVLLPYFLNAPKEESFKYDPKNAAVTIFDFEDGRFSPVAIDNVLHLNL